mmetsp:Transcript_134017/g.387863  ORF Transcript_134017/g.387863 Transcript_134017/m.387863 type:complete len:154 (-) Transcript_134017:139-600(-)
MADGAESDGSDEWGQQEELVIKKFVENDDDNPGNEDEDYWKVEPKEEEPPKEDPPKKKTETTSEPMIIVDITQIDANIHSKFDKNAVNDSAAASALRKRIESDYDAYSKDATMIADGTVIPCGSTVWRDALVRLRDERPGHYFAPIFPPKKKA